MDELQKAIDALTAALSSQAPKWQDGVLLALAKAQLVILKKLQEEGA
jgi:hypothetical protein